MDFINNIPPPPIVNYEKMDGSTLDYGPSRRQNQPLDMRPLSMPANERKRLERGSSCIVSMIIIGIVVSMILFTLIVWYYYDDIMEQLRNLKDFF
ncbi:hypothetical protein DICVIV_00596 [Dictyocaulus viviparus]|uniref:Uncharacterized protein n=1 Tax=Dictyocaulus viviparus TaxID=29172 RepID=A0A0D8Y985_DICVI|nr:hypothetical protein DICVIV_00596 [Dictyocaulus viviparus]